MPLKVVFDLVSDWAFFLPLNRLEAPERHRNPEPQNMKLHALIVEDEAAAGDHLAQLIADFVPEIEITGLVRGASEARQILNEHPIDLLFLDVHLPGESGFDLLDSLPERPFHLVFVTGFDQYAIRAIRCQALDYLLKPVDKHTLKATVDRLLQQEKGKEQPDPERYKEAVERSFHQIYGKESPDSLTLYHSDGFDLVRFENILFLKGEDNYTRFQLEDGSSKLVSRTLKEFEELLAPVGFIRIHKSSVINPRWIKSYRFENTGQVEMMNGERLEVARRRSRLLFDTIDRLSISTKPTTRFRS